MVPDTAPKVFSWVFISVLFFAQAVFCADHTAQGSLGEKLTSLLLKSRYPVSNVGVVLKNLDRDSVIVSLNADMPFNPASVAKLATAAMAFDKLGTGFTYKTRAYMGGAFNADSGPVTEICISKAVAIRP